MKRIQLILSDKTDWSKIYDGEAHTVFVEGEKQKIALGSPLRLDLVFKNGPTVVMRGKVGAVTSSPKGLQIAVDRDERDKLNYVRAYVRGGQLNLREQRRLPLHLRVTYGSLNGPRDSYTRDVNEEGLFLVANDPLPEGSEVHLFLYFPGEEEPQSLIGIVSHTVLVENEDIPGMGIIFKTDKTTSVSMKKLVDKLEEAFLAGNLPDSVFR